MAASLEVGREHPALGAWDEGVNFSVPGQEIMRRWVEGQPFRFLRSPSEDNCLPLALAKQKGR